MTEQHILTKFNQLLAFSTSIDVNAAIERLGFTIIDDTDDMLCCAMTGYIRDGILYFSKADMLYCYNKRMAEFPPPFPVTFDRYSEDVITSINQNPNFAKIIDNTPTYIALDFDVSRYTHIAGEMFIREPVFDAFRAFVRDYVKRPDVLRVWSPHHLFFNEHTDEIKMIDIGSLWYTRVHFEDPEIFHCVVDDKAMVYIFTTTPTTAQRVVLSMAVKELKEQGYTVDIKSVS